MKERPRAKALHRTTRTSDVTRVRTLALAALGAAVGAGTALAAGVTPSGSERPLARPHAREKIACAKCHEAPSPPSSASLSAAAALPPFFAVGACKACHAGAQHTSARPAHRALAGRGELTCAMCHPAHEGAQVSSPRPASARWAGRAEVCCAPA